MEVVLGQFTSYVGVVSQVTLASIAAWFLTLHVPRFGRMRRALLITVPMNLGLYLAFVTFGYDILPKTRTFFVIEFHAAFWWTAVTFYGCEALAVVLAVVWLMRKLGLVRTPFWLGVVGFCPPSEFDVEEAKQLIDQAFEDVKKAYPKRQIIVVSGLSDVGVLALAYQNAAKRGWKTVGIAPKQALGGVCFPVSKRRIIGKKYGDESSYFLRSIDGIAKIGGGEQAKREFLYMEEQGAYAQNYPLERL